MYTTFLSNKLKRREHVGDLNIEGKIILRRVLRKQAVKVWT
jgi:hypothetical protein